MFGKGAIILVLGFVVLFGVVAMRLNMLENRAFGNMAYYFSTTQSHGLASIGANVGCSKVYQDSSLRGVIASQSFTSGVFKGGSYSVRMDSVKPSELKLTSTSLYKNYRDTVEVYFNKNPYQSFAMYAWLTNSENSVNWIGADTVWGRVHSNNTLYINGKPVFFEKVTTAKSISPKPGTGLSQGIYKKGFETGIAPIDLPTNMDSINIAAVAKGKKYTRQIWITLSDPSSANNNGKAYIRYTKTGAIVDSINLCDTTTFNGVIYGTDSVCVQGTLDGKLTIGSNENIYITDDIKYVQNPLVTPGADDVCGLVANNYIYVTDPVPGSVNATTNLEIDACIFARSQSFTAQNYNTRTTTNAGTLTIIGGVIQNIRGPVSTVSNGIIQTGYSKRYRYDNRFGDPLYRPPFFPGFWKKTLVIINWWENVRIPTF
jgi:hypothetical protein